VKSFEEALAWLYGTQLFGVKLGLDSMERLAAELGIGLSGPHGFSERLSNRSTEGGEAGSVPAGARAFGGYDGFVLDRKIIHVAGTNGKGSTCALMASICQEAGLRTGLYTSPHLICFRERIQINGELIPEKAALEGLRKIRALVSDWNPHPKFLKSSRRWLWIGFSKTGLR